MALFELIVGLLFVGALSALWAERVGVPYPALLALVGALMALVPGAPEVGLDPGLALALFVAPALLDAAYDASPRDLRHHLSAVVSLAIGLVLVTTATVAVVARWVVPELGWAEAVALGAIVAPPDASAATAVLRKLGPPHRLLVVLEGESLFNDATALIVYRLAVGTAATGVLVGWSLVPTLLWTSVGSVVVGWALARAHVWMTLRVHEIAVNVLLQFVDTFAVWMLAEALGLSAIVTVVVFAMTQAARLTGRMPARHRLASYTVWEVAVLVLNVLAFVLVGLQLRGVASRLHGDAQTYALCAAVVCVTVIVVRFAWVFGYTAAMRPRSRRAGRPLATWPSWKNAAVASWCGMRGIVTLAAALALPVGPTAFPHRDLLVSSAFAVVLATLVLQGMTLGPMMRWLGLRDDGTLELEIAVAREVTARAALAVLSEDDAPAARQLWGEYRVRLDTAHVAKVGEDPELAARQQRAVEAQRDALRDLRSRHVIGEDAFRVVEEQIDLIELTAQARMRPIGEEPTGPR
jgi:CPA1 family monovalent cation:H+ antiporter